MIPVEAFICCIGCLGAGCFFLLVKLFEAQEKVDFYQRMSEGYRRQLHKAEEKLSAANDIIDPGRKWRN